MRGGGEVPLEMTGGYALPTRWRIGAAAHAAMTELRSSLWSRRMDPLRCALASDPSR